MGSDSGTGNELCCYKNSIDINAGGILAGTAGYGVGNRAGVSGVIILISLV